MRTIYKYELNIEDMVELQLPKGAKILSVQSQNDKPVLWCLVDTEAPKENRMFRLAGTGHEIGKEIENRIEFIGTFQILNGAFVGHLFEILTTAQTLSKAMGNNLFG
jgi:hypothetical protein